MMRTAYCVLRIGALSGASFGAYCVLRIAYCVFEARSQANFEVHCVLRTAYCVFEARFGANFAAYRVLRTAYCVFEALSRCQEPILRRIAYSVLRIAYSRPRRASTGSLEHCLPGRNTQYAVRRHPTGLGVPAFKPDQRAADTQLGPWIRSRPIRSVYRSRQVSKLCTRLLQKFQSCQPICFSPRGFLGGKAPRKRGPQIRLYVLL